MKKTYKRYRGKVVVEFAFDDELGLIAEDRAHLNALALACWQEDMLGGGSYTVVARSVEDVTEEEYQQQLGILNMEPFFHDDGSPGYILRSPFADEESDDTADS